MSKNNYPQGELDTISPGNVREIVGSLRELYDRGQPETDQEVEQRVNDFFAFCQNSSLRPGIESLCMALHISRVTLYNWCHGIGCSESRKELAQAAKSFTTAYLEQAVLQGKISPPSGIFLLKNWAAYKDTISFEESPPTTEVHKSLGISELPKLRGLDTDVLPHLDTESEE